MNDAFGHAVGDELLRRIAHILENTFADKGFVGRMGGDEFIVILDYLPEEMVEECLRELLIRVGKANASANRPYKISVSYGYADNYEKEYMSAWKVYEIADHHMYEYKKQYKEKGGV
jgi:diguanylate cyclase (GGDEF)-like protein